MIKYHVRSRSGVTLDMTKNKGQALSLAKKERANVYEVDSGTGKSTRLA